MSSNQSVSTLNDLIAITRDGKNFYEEAAGKVEDPGLQSLFSRFAASKSQVVAELGGAVQAAGGQPEQTGTMVGSMQQMYGKARAALGDRNYGYVAELEESEDRLLGAFKDALKDDETPPAARDVIGRLLPEVQGCHDVMRDRKAAMKRAH
jgi:uncharacterized protein (TIGR02284 family)